MYIQGEAKDKPLRTYDTCICICISRVICMTSTRRTLLGRDSTVLIHIPIEIVNLFIGKFARRI